MKNSSYRSLEDYLRSHPLHVDGLLENLVHDEFPMKGREIHAAILFADVRNFTGRTASLTSTETLAFLNYYFCWLSDCVLKDRRGIIDKYIGDEIMIVFSNEFGSEDPMKDALETAKEIAESDFPEFKPRIGIAAGLVTLGYVGSCLNYGCSVFGQPVALAKRCCGFHLSNSEEPNFSTSICLPNSDWKETFAGMFSEQRQNAPNSQSPQQNVWNVFSPRETGFAGFENLQVRPIGHNYFPGSFETVEKVVRDGLNKLREIGHYRPRSEKES